MHGYTHQYSVQLDFFSTLPHNTWYCTTEFSGIITSHLQWKTAQMWLSCRTLGTYCSRCSNFFQHHTSRWYLRGIITHATCWAEEVIEYPSKISYLLFVLDWEWELIRMFLYNIKLELSGKILATDTFHGFTYFSCNAEVILIVTFIRTTQQYWSLSSNHNNLDMKCFISWLWLSIPMLMYY